MDCVIKSLKIKKYSCINEIEPWSKTQKGAYKFDSFRVANDMLKFLFTPKDIEDLDLHILRIIPRTTVLKRHIDELTKRVDELESQNRKMELK